MTTPHWRSARRARARECELGVIGGGVTGVAMALHLQRRGVVAELLERRMLAGGASGRNAGFLMRGAAESYAACVRTYGRDRARDLWKLTEENLALLRDERIDSLPSYRESPSCLLALEQGEAADLNESADLLREDGFECELRTSGSDAPWRHGRPIVGLVNPNDGAINPVELVEHLATKLERTPVLGVEVRSVESVEDGVRIRTSADEIRCQRVVVCTNAYTGALLPTIGSMILPNRGQMLALRADGPQLEMAYYVDRGGEYFRRADAQTIVAGGCRRHHETTERTDEDRCTEEVQGEIERFLAPLLGLSSLDVVSRWSGIMGFTPDGLPLAGPVDEAGRIWLCAGFNGHGMSMAFRTAQLTAGALLDGGPAPFPPLRIEGAGRPADGGNAEAELPRAADPY